MKRLSPERTLIHGSADQTSIPLATLTKALATVSRARSRDDVIATIRVTARSLIGCEGITVILKDGDLCHYVEEDAIGPPWKGQKFPASACVSGWAMLNAETAVIPDISADRVPHELYAATFVRALAIAPVNVENPVVAIGALLVAALHSRRMGSGDA